LLALRQQVRLLRLRATAYERQIAELRQQVTTLDDLRAEIAELRERLGQNSRNSSRPPSSNPPSYKAKPPAEARGRKRGAQPGHRGHSRRLKSETEVTQIIEFRPAEWMRCGRKLRGDDPRPERHQVSELPRVKAEVTPIPAPLAALSGLWCGEQGGLARGDADEELRAARAGDGRLPDRAPHALATVTPRKSWVHCTSWW